MKRTKTVKGFLGLLGCVVVGCLSFGAAFGIGIAGTPPYSPLLTALGIASVVFLFCLTAACVLVGIACGTYAFEHWGEDQ